MGLETLPHPAKPDRISLKKKGAKVLEDNENEQSSVDNYAAAGVTGGEKYASAAGVSVSSSGTTDVVPVGSSEPGNLDKEDHDDRAGALLSDGSANVESTGIHPAWYAAGIASVGGGAALGLAAGAGGAVAAGGAAALPRHDRTGGLQSAAAHRRGRCRIAACGDARAGDRLRR